MNEAPRVEICKGVGRHYFSGRNVRWMNDARVTRYLTVQDKCTLWDAAKYYGKQWRSNSILLAIYSEGEQVCNCGFFDVVGGSAELRISMCEPSVWCKGIDSVAVKQMFEVAATANVGTFWLNVHPDNAGAVRAYEKNGFVHQGAVTFEDGSTQLHMVCSLDDIVNE